MRFVRQGEFDMIVATKSDEATMRYEVGPISPELNFGRTVRGLSMSLIADPTVQDELRALWVQHGLL